MEALRRGWIVGLTLLSNLRVVQSHAYLADPPSRNLVRAQAGTEDCPHCLNSNGPDNVATLGNNVWPTHLAPEGHGLCGDPVQGHSQPISLADEEYLIPTDPQRTYTAGSVVEFRVVVSTHHTGHYEFRLCNTVLDSATLQSPREGQDCLDKVILQRAPPPGDCVVNDARGDCQPIDTENPGRWYLPPRGASPPGGASWASGLPSVTEVHTMKYVIPADFTCTKCTLQWYYATANSCLPDNSYRTYFQKLQSLGWAASSWSAWAVASWATCDQACCGPAGRGTFGEEFWNCADIVVLEGNGVPTPSPTPTPAPITTVPVVTTTTTPSGPCAAEYEQCGGNNYNGPTCCQAGTYCKFSNEWYSQCLAGTDPNPTPAPTPVPVTTASPITTRPATTGRPSQCSCVASTSWDGSFDQFAASLGGNADFCAQNFGGSGPYISGGGGTGSSGGHSGSGPCQSGQYSFSEDGWKITVSAAQGTSKTPYRAFAYLNFCGGSPYSSCWSSDVNVFSFSFQTAGAREMGAFVKLLFWTDGGSILGLVPPKHAKGSGKLRLVSFMSDDYPNNWQDETEVEDGVWYHVTVTFWPPNSAVEVKLQGVPFSGGSIPVNMLGSSNGPQLGVYSFDYSGSWPSNGFTLWINHPCVGQSTCSPATTSAMPTTTTLPSTTGTAPAGCSLPSGMQMGSPVDRRGFAYEHGKLKLSGAQLVNLRGDAVQLKGMSTHGLHWFPDCYEKGMLEHLVSSWGITVFRAAMYIGEGGYASDKSVAQLVDEIVNWGEEFGVYIMIDWHVLTPGDPNHWLTGTGVSQADAAAYWRETALKYRSKTHVLYEICNEPNGVNWPTVKSYADNIISVIREVDPDTIIIVGTPTWSQDIHEAAANPVQMPYNVMYAFHFYAGTHSFLLPRLRQYASQIPIFATEWGTSQANGDGGPYLAQAKEFLDLFGSGELGVTVSWAQWSLADKAEVSAALASGSCGADSWESVSCSGFFVRSYLRMHAADPTTTGPPPTSTVTTKASTFPPTTTPATTTMPTTQTTTTTPQVSTTTRTVVVTMGPPIARDMSAECGRWCQYNDNDWATKCTWIGCSLCAGCGTTVSSTTAAPSTQSTTKVTTTTPAPTTTTTTKTTTTTTSTNPATTSPSGPCAAQYGQCGGMNHNGPTCCQPGSTCTFGNDYYSQCLPGSSPTPSPTPSPPPPTPTPSPPSPTPTPSPPSPSPSPSPPGVNPFEGHPWYVNPSYRDLLSTSINLTSGTVRTTLESMQNVPSAFWIDVKSKIYKGQGHPDHSTVEGILEDAASCSPPSLVVLIVYDLPNRDCFALASNGEICCHYGEDKGRTKCDMSTSGPNAGFYREVVGANCADGLQEYKETYIDPFAEVVGRFADRVPIVLVIEPDSLPNLVTNMKDKRPDNFRGCHDETKVAYEEGIKYAVEKLSATGAQLYVDAGHGGWLGWANSNDDQTGKFANIIASMQIAPKVRGFATNVANYQPLGNLICSEPGKCKGEMSNDPCCADDPCSLQKDWNWAHNELNYVDVLDYKMRAAIPGFTPSFIIDTGRNGKPNTRSDCGNWCNARGAGVGHVPTTATPDARIDAYFWLKTPGESDGCTEILPDGSNCPRFDEMCASVDSLGSRSGEPRAPEAGLWYHYQIAMLAENADMGDASVFSDPGSCGSISGAPQVTVLTDASVRSPTARHSWRSSSMQASNQGVTMLALNTRHARMLFVTDNATEGFEGKDGGMDRACRGATASDNSPNHYEVHSVASLDECKEVCMATEGCKGIEFSKGRCEVWTRPGGIQATIELAGFSCYTYGEMSVEDDFLPVDGGVDRACRGGSKTDNSPNHYEVHSAASVDECKAVCMAIAGCKGIEYSAGRCEVWTRAGGIQASIELSGFSCYTYEGMTVQGEFAPIDGGVDRACRGGGSTDNSPNNYEVHPAGSMDECKAVCMSIQSCKGIEYSPGRCEVWTRADGIEASIQLAGFSCYTYHPGPTTMEKCSQMSEAQMAQALSVSQIPLPFPRHSQCSSFGMAISCRHVHYAATAKKDWQAVLYNDAMGKPQLVLLDGTSIATTQTLSSSPLEVRGVDFDPSGGYLVVLLSGGSTFDSPSLFKKFAVPSLQEVWSTPIRDSQIGLERWTPDAAQSLAVSSSRYVQHSAGECRSGWCSGHQGGMTVMVDANGQQQSYSGDAWASHSCKQMAAYSAISDTFLLGTAGDAYPDALVFSTLKDDVLLKTASFQSWGDGAGSQGISSGAIKADLTGGFGAVWTYGEKGGIQDKLYFATFAADGSFVTDPRPLFDGSGSEIGGNLVPLSDGNWLVAFAESATDVIPDYLRTLWDDWSLPEDLRLNGSRLAVVSPNGQILKDGMKLSPEAGLPIEINHLVMRPSGFSWASVDASGQDLRIAHLKCT